MGTLVSATREGLTATGLPPALFDVILEAQQARAAQALSQSGQGQAAGLANKIKTPQELTAWLQRRGSPIKRDVKPLLSESAISLLLKERDLIARDLWSVTAERFENRLTDDKEEHPLCYYVGQLGIGKRRVLHELPHMLTSQAELHRDHPLASALQRDGNVVHISITFSNGAALEPSELGDLDTALYLRILHAYFDGQGLYGAFGDFVSQLETEMGPGVTGSVERALLHIRDDIRRRNRAISRDEPVVILISVDDVQALLDAVDAAGFSDRRDAYLESMLSAIWGPSTDMGDAGVFYVPLVVGGTYEDMNAAISSSGYRGEPLGLPRPELTE